jgi:hypothetical protein
MKVKLTTLLVILLLFLSATIIFFSAPVAAAEDYKFSVNIKINDDTSNKNQNIPKIAITNSGQICMVWTDARNDTNNDIFFSKSTDGGNIFGDGVANTDKMINDDGIEASQRDVAIATYNNDIYVVWMDDRSNYYHIYFSKSTDGGATFSTNKKVDDAPNDKICEYPDIAVTSVGYICVVWHDTRDDANFNVYYSESTNGGTSFSSSIRVDDTGSGTTSQKYPKIAIGGNNDKYVTWQDNRNGNYDIYSAHASSTIPTTSFDNNKRVDDTSTATSDQTRPTIGASGSTNVYIAWRDERNTQLGDIFFARSTDMGSTFLTFLMIRRPPRSTPLQDFPDLTVDSSGNIHVVWMDKRTSRSSRPTNQRIYYSNSTNSGSSFKTNVRVDDTANQNTNVDKRYPNLAALSTKKIFVCWEDRRNGNYDTYFSRWGKASDMLGYAPTLTSGAINQQLAGIKDDIKYTVVYTDIENDAPASGYPKVAIYTDQTGTSQISGSPFAMTVQLAEDGIYSNGEIFYYKTKLTMDNTYYFKYITKAATGNATTVITQIFSGPKIDNTLPTFLNPRPSSDVWFNSKNLNCSVFVSDGDGSGVESLSIAYQTKTNGSTELSRWFTNIDRNKIGNDYDCTTTVTFTEGEENYIRWNASDKIGYGYGLYTLSEFYEVKIDTTPTKFTDPTPSDEYWQNTESVTCSITISDLEGSGINVSSIQYYYRLASDFLWTGPLQANIVPSGDIITATTASPVPFENSEFNYIKWHAKDIAGNLGESNEFQIKIDTSRPPNTPPVAPTWIKPDETKDSTPQIEWSPGFDADADKLEYFIQIGTSSGGEDILKWTSAGSNTFYLLENALIVDTYYIQIKTYDGLDNSSILEEILNITTTGNDPPLPPTAIFPDVSSEHNPIINWTPPVTGQNLRYFIQIGTSSGAGNILFWKDVGTAVEYTVQNTLSDGIYYIQLRSQNDAGTSYIYEETIKIATFNPELSVPNEVTIKQGTTGSVKLTLTNNCSVEDTITIAIEGELVSISSVTMSLAPPSPITFQPYETKNISFLITIPPKMSVDDYQLDIRATSEDGVSKSFTRTLIIHVKASGGGSGNGGTNGPSDKSDDESIPVFLIILIIIIIVIIALIAAAASSSKKKRTKREKDDFFRQQDEYDKLYGPHDDDGKDGQGPS